VLVTPRDPNPYQELLHRELRAKGHTVSYLDGPTGSHTANLLLRPAHLLARRIGGYRVLHIHWVYDWLPMWAPRVPGGRRAAQFWFALCLTVARSLGYRIVWTAHNLMPHERTFHDDDQARRRLASASDAVFTHSDAARGPLVGLGARRVYTIRDGPYGRSEPGSGRPTRAEARQRLGIPPGRIVLHFGVLRDYKGADRLARAVADLRHGLTLVIAGRCTDTALRDQLEALALRHPDRLIVRLGWVSQDDLDLYVAAADAAAFAFRSVTNSSSVSLALEHGLPVMIPKLDVFSDIPSTAAIRYPNSDEGLGAALEQLGRLRDQDLAVMAEAARGARAGRSWVETARETGRVYEGLLAGGAAL
jgi:glycosyltransferase involved in cell wall biosynthesis